jgi:hypothetical protein
MVAVFKSIFIHASSLCFLYYELSHLILSDHFLSIIWLLNQDYYLFVVVLVALTETNNTFRFLFKSLNRPWELIIYIILREKARRWQLIIYIILREKPVAQFKFQAVEILTDLPTTNREGDRTFPTEVHSGRPGMRQAESHLAPASSFSSIPPPFFYLDCRRHLGGSPKLLIGVFRSAFVAPPSVAPVSSPSSPASSSRSLLILFHSLSTFLPFKPAYYEQYPA